MKLLDKISLLIERRRHERVFPKETIVQSLERYKGKNVYVSFQDINKLGINPEFTKKWRMLITPIGIYSFQISDVLRIIDKETSFIRRLFFSKQFILIVKPKSSARILEIQSSTYDAEVLQQDYERIIDYFVNKNDVKFALTIKELYDEEIKNHNPKTTLNVLHNMCLRKLLKMKPKDNFSKRDQNLASNVFFRKILGYDIVYDRIAFFSSDIESQMIFLSSSSLEIVETLINPLEKDFWRVDEDGLLID